jgi:hypothetical protein
VVSIIEEMLPELVETPAPTLGSGSGAAVWVFAAAWVSGFSWAREHPMTQVRSRAAEILQIMELCMAGNVCRYAVARVNFRYSYAKTVPCVTPKFFVLRYSRIFCLGKDRTLPAVFPRPYGFEGVRTVRQTLHRGVTGDLPERFSLFAGLYLGGGPGWQTLA